MNYKEYIREVQNFPIVWVDFKDITPLLQNPKVFSKAIDELSLYIWDADVILWLDARWFIFAWALAHKLNKPLIIIRKSWKLPFDTFSVDYDLEYWKNTFEIHIDSIKKWQKIAIVDDLLATWWTAKAACDLVEKSGWIIDSINFLIDLKFLDGNKLFNWYNINHLVEY